ncbi:SDR family NAD(P)-dependent oxidoreductase [Bacillus sp. Marseille-P3800]|uniref:SDR family NAD(P)-dependent oxidoreductase n=1 Tax=Bacillus sp. Marseille-P3800 TaxID=2014782 RepID=UPI000C06F701|nr:SDR family NAD(P)-dependent oxidoreductase [Bacillus sp. Marseille-P3800]
MNHSFEKKTALVTGAASGIGEAITRQLIEGGATVVGADLNEEALQNMQETFNDQFLPVVADVTKEADHERLVEKAVTTFGSLDFAFNVAGANKTAPIMEQSEEDWRFVIDLVLNGVFLGMKHQARQMKKQGGGAIVNVSSLNARVPMYSGAAYASSKAGVEMLTKNGALELARHGIRVNAILPGLVETPITDSFTKNKSVNTMFMDRIPMKRVATPDEIASPSIFLVSEAASYVNGASLIVDGAWATSGYPDLSLLED